LTGEVVREEMETAFDYIRRAPDNESPWNYVRG
jgi:hypothetical protein